MIPARAWGPQTERPTWRCGLAQSPLVRGHIRQTGRPARKISVEMIAFPLQYEESAAVLPATVLRLFGLDQHPIASGCNIPVGWAGQGQGARNG